MVLGKDALSNAVGDVVQNVGSPMQAVCPVFPRSDTDMLLKVLFCANVFSLSCACKMGCVSTSHEGIFSHGLVYVEWGLIPPLMATS